ncbi:MAG TPA: DNA replication/repair protein RecF [Egibacteraceae bacterium]|nr:DNA replication/repair protein RecF [Egibacteraceae bacterium]
MYLERIELVDFRSYRSARVDPRPGATVFIGANGQGKTNLLEAVHYLAINASHRVSSDAPLVRTGADAAIVRAVARVGTGPASVESHRARSAADRDGQAQPPADEVASAAAGVRIQESSEDGRRLTVELELRPSGRNRVKVNGQAQARSRDAIGLIRSVLFAPEDLQLVRGDPAERRRFLDHLLTQRRPAYLAARQDYDRVLRQRNALLRDGRGHGGGQADAVLQTWTEALAVSGATVLAARIAVVHALAGPVSRAYSDLADDGGARAPSISYQLSTGRAVAAAPGAGVPDPSELAAELREGLERVAVAERQRGVTLAGPHRDELTLGLGDQPAKGYASHGEMWSLALSLRLASHQVLLEVGEEPIILLDDVFAELDVRRRQRLAHRCAEFEQVLVTAAVDEDVPLAGPRHVVRAGEIAPASRAAPHGGDDAP